MKISNLLANRVLLQVKLTPMIDVFDPTSSHPVYSTEMLVKAKKGSVWIKRDLPDCTEARILDGEAKMELEAVGMGRLVYNWTFDGKPVTSEW